MGNITPTVTKAGPTSWAFTWTGTGPYKLYLNGAKVLTSSNDWPTDDTSITLYNSDTNEAPPLEVLDSTVAASTAENVKYSPRGTLQWRGVSDANYYQIEQYVGAAWTTLDNIIEDGRGYYTFLTDALTDATAYQFRIVPIDNEGYEAEPLPYTWTVCRNPAPPSITGTYSTATGNLTIASA